MTTIPVYAQEEVSIVVDSCKIKGTLEVPKSNNPIEVALIIAGSGPTDRDGNSKLLPGKNNSLKLLADCLFKNGIASLRYDKRGIGESDKVKEEEMTFDQLVTDAVEWVHFLQKDKRFSKIFIIGHSEGSLIGMMAAERTNTDKFVSLCGTGQPAYSIIEEQLIGNNLPQELLKECRVIMDSLKHGQTVKNVNLALVALFRQSVQPYLISWFKYDPCVEISKLKIPILVVGGTTDIQVGIKDAELLSRANKESIVVTIANMNHILKEVLSKDINEQIQSYGNPELKLSNELERNILKFFKE